MATTSTATAAADIKAIHTLKGKLSMGDDDYRALLVNLTGIASSKDMSSAQRQQVRAHMQSLAERMGVASSKRRAWLSQAAFAAKQQAASPKERLAYFLWAQLHRAGVVRDGSRPALGAFVKRVAGVDALRFCNAEQLDAVIKALRDWCAKDGVATR